MPADSQPAAHRRKPHNMLFLLAVLSAATAAPAPDADAQVPLSYYNPYLHYYPQYQQRYAPMPQYQAQVPFYYYPPYPQYSIQTPASRSIINLGGFLQQGAAFTAMAAVTTGTVMSAKTLTGDITFFQNPFTLNNAKYHVNLPNVAANTPIGIYIHAASGGCDDTAATATTITELTKLTTPIFQINGAYVDGTTNLVNLDGAGGKTDISGRRISIRDESGTTPASIIGCTSAGIA